MNPAPPTYDGSTCFSSFVATFNRFHNARDSASLRQAREMFPLCLQGDALFVYENIPQDIVNGKWSEFLLYMQEQLYPQAKRHTAQLQLNNMAQQDGESVAEFFKRCDDVARVAHPGVRYAADRETFLRFCFIKGSNEAIREKLQREETMCTSYELLKKAQREEQFIKQASLHQEKTTDAFVYKPPAKHIYPAAPTVLFLSCLALLVAPSMAELWTAIHPMSFIDCTDMAKEFVYITPPKPSNCNIPLTDKYLRGTAKMMKANDTLHKMPAFKCKLEVFQKCSFVIFIGSFSNDETGIEVKKPTVDECKSAFETRVWRNLSLTSNPALENVLYSDFDKPWPNAHWVGSECVNTTRMVIEVGWMAELKNPDTLVSNVMNISKNCKITDEMCESDQAVLLWDIADRRNPCDYTVMDTVEALIGDRVLIVEKYQNVYALDEDFQPDSAKHCFDSNVTFSSGSMIFFVFNETTTKGHTHYGTSMRVKRESWDVSNVEYPGLNGFLRHQPFAAAEVDERERAKKQEQDNLNLNVRLMYSNTKADEKSKLHFNKLVNMFCEKRNEMLATWELHLHTEKDPSPAIRSLLNRKNIKATSKGRNIFKIRDCKEVIIVSVKEDQAMGDDCRPTVMGRTADNKTFNIHPDWPEVQPHPEPVPCDEVHGFIFMDPSGVYRERGIAKNITAYMHSELPEYTSRTLILSGVDVYTNHTSSSLAVMMALSFGNVQSAQIIQSQEERPEFRFTIDPAVGGVLGMFHEAKAFCKRVASDLFDYLTSGIFKVIAGVVGGVAISVLIWFQCKKSDKVKNLINNVNAAGDDIELENQAENEEIPIKLDFLP